MVLCAGAPWDVQCSDGMSVVENGFDFIFLLCLLTLCCGFVCSHASYAHTAAVKIAGDRHARKRCQGRKMLFWHGCAPRIKRTRAYGILHVFLGGMDFGYACCTCIGSFSRKLLNEIQSPRQANLFEAQRIEIHCQTLCAIVQVVC